MKAVILNSGIGSRMGKFTEGNPKCLTLLDGTTLLGHQLTILSSLGIGEFIITTGPFAEKIEEYVKKHFPNLSVTYVHNPKYSETNYIYSLYLARENLDDDIILMHGDIVCDPIILKRVMMHDGNGVLINRESELPKKDFKGRLENDRVTEIGIHIFDENCYELMPVYKLSRAAARAWLEEIENFVEANNVEVYAEEAFNKINSEIGLGPISYTEFCMEIDTPQDLEEAKKQIQVKLMSEYRSLDAIHEIMQKENAKKIFLVTGKTSFEKSGAKDRLDLSDVTQFSDYEPNPKIEDIRQGIELFREQNCDVVLAIGGGSTIDVAKAINIIGSHAGDPEPYVKKEREFEHRGKPFIAVPTTSGSGSEATHFAVIYINGKKYSLAHPEYLLPDYVLLDYTLTMSMPKNVTASSGMDAIAQATEAYWSVNSNDESREYSRRAILLALEHIQDAVNDPTAEARIGMQNAANLAGKAINITKTTAPHAASYALTTYHGIPHGHAVGLTLGEFFVFNEGVSEDDVWDERGCAAVQKAIGELVEIYGVKDAGEANLFLKRLMESIGLDTKLSSFGVTEANLQRLIDAVNFERLKNNPRRVQKEDLEEIYLRVL